MRNSSEERAAGGGAAPLGLFDAVSIILGIVIGATIYETPQLIFSNVSGPWEGMAAWTLGGVLSLVGALCYAELTTAWPRSGGDYVYLSRAYGGWMGFLFGWAQLTALSSANIGMMAYIFANYAVRLWGPTPLPTVAWAMLAVIVLTVVNAAGVRFGKGTQNVLTACKVLGLAAIVAAGLLAAGPESAPLAMGSAPATASQFGFAMIFVLLAYGGWNDAALVTAEVRNVRRNLPLALLLGTGGVTLIYLAVNVAYLSALGFEGVRASSAPAADTLGVWLGERGSRGMSVLVMVSALGAVNGLILTSARIYAGMGADHRLFAVLGRWNRRTGSPTWAVAVQGMVAVGLVVLVGTEMGLRMVNAFLTGLHFEPVTSLGSSGFDALLKATAPIFWSFFLLTGVAVIVLRFKEPETERPFRVPLFPLLPLIFCGMCLYMLHSAVDYAGRLALLGLVPVLLGGPLYLMDRLRGRSA